MDVSGDIANSGVNCWDTTRPKKQKTFCCNNRNVVTNVPICKDAPCKSNIIGDKCDECINGFFGFPNCQSKWFSFSIFHAFPHQINYFQSAIVKTRDQKVWHVTKEMESVTAKHTLLVTIVTIVTNVLMDFMGFQTAEACFYIYIFCVSSKQSMFYCFKYLWGHP